MNIYASTSTILEIGALLCLQTMQVTQTFGICCKPLHVRLEQFRFTVFQLKVFCLRRFYYKTKHLPEHMTGSVIICRVMGHSRRSGIVVQLWFNPNTRLSNWRDKSPATDNYCDRGEQGDTGSLRSKGFQKPQF